ncbi:maleylpyruvate isomerase family mycothiol-dependent enzyme [Streptomyces sp. enrichment culture]|uniref:maleylpyruvate isomerase family mycothiol-dependent enzyme n=1 Tax=Streptomyces sp. enrichment culture TaxID=1795815 RepID=UPI003F5702E8
MRDPEALADMEASTNRFITTVRSLTDEQVRGETLIPPWTRGHVVTHVARATDSLCRLLRSARTGVETPQYASMEARAAEIEAGADRPAGVLVADVLDAAARFDREIRALPPEAWRKEVRLRTGEHRTPAGLILTRVRELEVHHADLAAGYAFADIPGDTARWIIDDIVAALRRRTDVQPLTIESTDTDLTRTLSPGTDEGPTVSGPQAALLAWLSGRATPASLTAVPGDVPPPPTWI